MFCNNYRPNYSRREFLTKTSLGLGALALGSLLAPLGVNAKPAFRPLSGGGGILGKPHFAPKAKRVIYLFQSGGPSQLDLFDHKPLF